MPIGGFDGWRGEILLRGAIAPLGGLLPLNNRVYKRTETLLPFFPPLK